MTYVDRLTRKTKEVRGEGGDSVRAGAGVHAHPAEFLDARISQRSGKFQRRAGPLPDGPRRRRRAPAAALPDLNVRPSANPPHRPNGIYMVRFRNTPSSSKHPHFIRGYGFQGESGPDFDFGRGGLRGGVQESGQAGKLRQYRSAPSANRWPAGTTSARSIRT